MASTSWYTELVMKYEGFRVYGWAGVFFVVLTAINPPQDWRSP